MARKTPRTPRAKSTSTPTEAVAFAPAGFALVNQHIERALITGEDAGALRDYFGDANYRDLRDLAREASTRSLRGGPRVLILPGIMGSRLGRPGINLEHVIWLNPAAIGVGWVEKLKLNGGPGPYTSVGVILLAYLRMKLVLRLHGYDADFYDYDWRQSIDALGEKLARDLKNEPASQVYLVAHSMGGLVARAAFKQGAGKVARLIMLGTPNYGSFAPAQVFRGTYDVVQEIARIDLRHSAEELCNTVFNTFPGLYQMLPWSQKFSALNLFDASVWPATGPKPLQKHLTAASRIQESLAPYDDRCFLIAGINQDTVTDMTISGGEFSYSISKDGDGTVPLRFARLDNMPDSHVYYVVESHGSLPNNGSVESAVCNLIAAGSTTVLSNQRPQPARAIVQYSEPELLARLRSGRPQELGSSDFRHVLDCVASPDSSDRRVVPVAKAVAAASGTLTAVTPTLAAERTSFQDLVIGRRRQKRMELTIAHGSLTDVVSRAYVLGMFRNVVPSGAARAIDNLLGGAISDFTARRMFGGEAGEVFTVPVGRKALGADMVVFAGLGSFDEYTADAQQLAAENVMRVLARTGVEEFATVLIGAGTGRSTGYLLQSLLTGFLNGLKDTNARTRFRGITICETDNGRYEEIKSELLRLASTAIFADIELSLEELELPPHVEVTAGIRGFRRNFDPVYLLLRNESNDASYHFRSSVLSSGSKAAVISGEKSVARTDADKLLSRLNADEKKLDLDAIDRFGNDLARLILPDEICAALQNLQTLHLVVVHDAAGSRFPWETLQVNGATPALNAGLSRRYLADDLPLAKWLEQRRSDGVLSMLLVTNPTGDLDGADKEGERIRKIAASVPSLKLTELVHEKATRLAIKGALQSGKYDVLHYAGHASFNPDDPGSSGLRCADEVLKGSDLAGISNLPALVFFNACETARTRKAPAGGNSRRARAESAVMSQLRSERARQTSGVAESLFRGGIANFVGTYWPVGDDAAMQFAENFYNGVLKGQSIGEAMLAGRKAVRTIQSRDWADYVLYGSYDFVLESAL